MTSSESQTSWNWRRFAARLAMLMAIAATLFAVQIAVRWAVGNRMVPTSAIDVTATFIFHWYAIAAAWGVWREGESRRRAVNVAAWISLGLTLWIFAGLYNGQEIDFDRGEAIAAYNVTHWGIFFALAAIWLMLVRVFWGIRIVQVSKNLQPLTSSEREDRERFRGLNALAWCPSVSIGGLMFLTAVVAVVAAFLRYAPGILSIVFEGILTPGTAASLCVDPISGSIYGVALLTFAALACSSAGRNLVFLAGAAVVAFGLALAIQYISFELTWGYFEYVLYEAVSMRGAGWIDVTAPLIDRRIDLTRSIASTLLAFVSVLALPSLGYRIVAGRETRSRRRARQSIDSFSVDI